MNASQTIDTRVIANDFRNAMHDKLEPGQIEEAIQALIVNRKAYPVTGSVASRIFYLQFQLDVADGMTFDGDAGGAASPGGDALSGRLYTEDLERLYRDTVSFEYQSMPIYLSILFFDRNNTLLGHFMSGAVSIVTDIGGGKGSWR